MVKILKQAGVSGEINLTVPPKPEMGDLAFACFDIAKQLNVKPQEIASKIVLAIRNNTNITVELSRPSSLPDSIEHEAHIINVSGTIISSFRAFGPYVNFFLNSRAVADEILGEMKSKGKNYGANNSGAKKKVMVEFAHPNTHKAVHIGHLRNMITGESMVRLLENSNFKVVRANYQGDVGMQVAKCLWGVEHLAPEYEQAKKAGVSERAKFLGQAYAFGAQAFEKDEQAKQEIGEYNKKIYSQDKAIKKIYALTRKWSLEYFDAIYRRVGVNKFDHLYFESEMPKRAVEIVRAGLKSGIFKESQGAVIFEGSKYGLHDRVFLNSQGLPVYEAKDQALAQMQFKEYNPTEILHLVAKEQTEYFKVIFKALEFTLPESIGREKHLMYGWVSLKEGKMSSRTGQVVLAEWLLDEVEKKIAEVMKERQIKNQAATIKKIAIAAVKYSMLKTGVGNNIIFDINESISLTGSSGPYLLYIGARIQSILRKAGAVSKKLIIPAEIAVQEKNLLLKLGEFEEVTAVAATEYDPSKIAHYLFDLAKKFNEFYDNCPVIQATGDQKIFRLNIIQSVYQVMERGLYLLGIETVEEM